MVLCWCGSRLVTAELVDAEAPARDECPMCMIRLTRPRSGRLTVAVTVQAVTR